MCGIAGILNSFLSLEGLANQTQLMTDSLYHRGPDHGGVSVSSDGSYALGHRRLSILDLSHASDQPMLSSCGRYELVYNGEIYNFKELHRQFGLKTGRDSDTQVLVELISSIGLEKTLSNINGMFAFAVVDRKEKLVYLARDRAGKKPLYYGHACGQFVFASELKAIKALPDFVGTISKRAVNLYFKYLSVPAPYSIYENIWKLEPGCYAKLPLSSPEKIEVKKYWDLNRIALTTNKLSREEWQPRLEELLTDSVKQRMISDVPLGAFLSGGIDSSLVVSLMQKLSDRPVKTFSIGTYDDKNEAKDAKAIAQHLETDHTELYVDDADVLGLVDGLPSIWDEPFADSSQIPTLIVSQLARQSVTVALSGDGGDEFFAGYNRYLSNERLWQQVQAKPKAYKRLLSLVADSPIGKAASFAGDKFFKKEMHLHDKLKLWAGIYGIQDRGSMYDFMLSSWQNDNRVLSRDYLDTDIKSISFETSLSNIENMMLADQQNYLPNDILTKVDRASMHHSLEVRAPLLDYRILELAWQIPIEEKLIDGTGKMPLRRILYDHVPEGLLDSPKRGFGVPVHHWLVNELREWADDLLDANRMKEDGILNYEYISWYWKRVKELKVLPSKKLWTVLMFQAWLRGEKN